MSLYFDDEWLKQYEARGGKYRDMSKKARSEGKPQAEKPKRRNKYNARKTEFEGDIYDSKHEAEVSAQMKMLGKALEFKGLAKQVTFYLPGGVTYKADFVTLNHDGTYTVYDAKGEATKKDKAYRIKKKQMENCLGLEIKEV